MRRSSNADVVAAVGSMAATCRRLTASASSDGPGGAATSDCRDAISAVKRGAGPSAVSVVAKSTSGAPFCPPGFRLEQNGKRKRRHAV